MRPTIPTAQAPVQRREDLAQLTYYLPGTSRGHPLEPKRERWMVQELFDDFHRTQRDSWQPLNLDGPYPRLEVNEFPPEPVQPPHVSVLVLCGPYRAPAELAHEIPMLGPGVQCKGRGEELLGWRFLLPRPSLLVPFQPLRHALLLERADTVGPGQDRYQCSLQRVVDDDQQPLPVSRLRTDRTCDFDSMFERVDQVLSLVYS